MAHLTVRGYMTKSPFTVGADQPLAVAHRVMREHRIRHLPVLSAGKLVGVVTERDLELVEALPGSDAAAIKVGEAMTPMPYAIEPQSSLEWVALEMAEHKYGCTVVVERGRVIGVFTTVDALRALTDLLARARRRGKHAAHAPWPHGLS
ncbi:MAG TPA: CBS domain-containing protein [Polyangia bacterium]|nr:CBS domain-containing protein [Polyangia bacterium]